jgi:hypothetical protein
MGTNSRVDPLSCGLDQKKKEKKKEEVIRLKKIIRFCPLAAKFF